MTDQIFRSQQITNRGIDNIKEVRPCSASVKNNILINQIKKYEKLLKVTGNKLMKQSEKSSDARS